MKQHFSSGTGAISDSQRSCVLKSSWQSQLSRVGKAASAALSHGIDRSSL